MEKQVVVQLPIHEYERILVEAARQGASIASEQWEKRLEKLTRAFTLATKSVLTLDEAARLYGRKARTLRAWIKEGTLKGERTGRGYVVERADVEACLCKAA